LLPLPPGYAALLSRASTAPPTSFGSDRRRKRHLRALAPPPKRSKPSPRPSAAKLRPSSRSLRPTSSRRSSHSLVATGSSRTARSARRGRPDAAFFGVPPAACLARLPWCGVAPAVVAQRVLVAPSEPRGVREEFFVTWPSIEVESGRCVAPAASRRLREAFRASRWCTLDEVKAAKGVVLFDAEQGFMRRMRLT
jgi:hypothetical protein